MSLQDKNDGKKYTPSFTNELKRRAQVEKQKIRREARKPNKNGNVGLREGFKMNKTLEREFFAADCILAGNTLQQIHRKFNEKYEKEFNIQTIQNYLKEARKKITNELFANDKEIAQDVLAKYMWLYGKATEKEDFREARNVLDSIVKLTQRVQLDVTSAGEKLNMPEIIEVIQVRNIQLDNQGEIEEVDFEETQDNEEDN